MEWLDVIGFSNYEVSENGQIRNKRSGKTLKPYDNGNGYLKVTLCENGKKKREFVHRIVGFAFIEGYEEGYTIQHINHDRQCNEKNNLEWIPLEDNVREMHQYRKGVFTL